MNTLISSMPLRSLLSNSLLRRIPQGRPIASQSACFAHNLAKKSQVSPVSQITKSNYITIRSSNVWSKAIKIKSNDSHGSMWLLERVIAIGTITSFVAMFIHPCENSDLFFTLVISIHAHAGIEAIMVDYLRPAVVGNVIPKLIPALSLMFSCSMLVLLAWVAVYGNGIAGSLQQLWYLDPTIEPYDEDDSKLNKREE